MTALSIRGLAYRYPSAAHDVLRGVDLDVAPGELVVLTGPTGCGKSTLLRLAAGLLQRHGRGVVTGSVRVGGVDPATSPPSERVGRLGFISQSPERQIVAGTLGDEVAFGMESAGSSRETLESRVPELLARVGLPVEPERSTEALSGGQKQRLVVAAGLSAGAPLLLLDEPLAQLDPGGADALVAVLRRVADEGAAVLVVEHRLPRVLEAADRVVVLEAGQIVHDAPELDRALGRRLGLSLPGLADLEDRLAGREPVCPVRPAPSLGAPVAQLEGATWTHRGALRPALAPTTWSIAAGERVAVLGPNGAGKSTLLQLVTGALPSGDVRRIGRVVDVPQDPDRALFCATVEQELLHGPTDQRRPDPGADAAEAAAALSVGDLLPRAPQALSRGQRLRVAVAAALASRPDLLVLDEPTSGQDHDQVERMMRGLAGHTVVFATHDVGLALRHATRLVLLEDGRIVADGPPAEVVREQAARLDLPPLARWCLDRGLPVATAAELAGEG